jgi:O-acetyl-ADP-ribose deacetylase (regulator of RNase III)
MMSLLAERIRVTQDDITRLNMDIIVNTAKESLSGGGYDWAPRMSRFTENWFAKP